MTHVKSAYVVEAHYEVEERMERISKLLDEARKLKEEITELSVNLKSLAPRGRYTIIDELINSVTKTKELSEPSLSEEDLASIEDSLASYVEKLRSRVNNMRAIIDKIRQLTSIIRSLETTRSELIRWEPIIRNLDSRIVIEVKRVLNNIDRYLTLKPTATNLDELIVTLSEILLESRDATKLCRNLYEKRINEIKRKINTADSLFRQARQITYLNELRHLSEEYKNITNIRELMKKLQESVDLPQDVDFIKLDKMINEFIELCKMHIEKGMGTKEADLLKALSSFTKSKDSLPLHSLIEKLARMTDLSISEVLHMLYRLDKQNIVLIRVKVRC